jgi:hypothetical protein
MAASDLYALAQYPEVRPSGAVPSVAFLPGGADYILPLEHETHEWDGNNYHTFFVWTQRLGLMPRVAETPDEALACDAIVLIRPRGQVDDRLMSRLTTYVQGGGSLIVLEDPGAPGSSNLILARFNMAYGEAASNPSLSLDGIARFQSASSVELASALEVRGGTPLFRTTRGTPVASWSPWHRGRVVAVGFARPFSVDVMGMPKGVPSEYQVAISELEYALLEKALADGNEADSSRELKKQR